MSTSLEKTEGLLLRWKSPSVIDGSIFGLIECDLEVPERLKDFFAEMPPIFKNTNISREDIGEHMQRYAEREGMMKTPRRSLIGSMFASRLFFATPLLRWYLLHGLKVTQIYQVVQFAQSPCFKPFGEAVSNARRDEDVDPTKAIIADTMKLLVNSAYGKTVTDQEKHLDVKLCTTNSGKCDLNVEE